MSDREACVMVMAILGLVRHSLEHLGLSSAETMMMVATLPLAGLGIGVGGFNPELGSPALAMPERARFGAARIAELKTDRHGGTSTR